MDDITMTIDEALTVTVSIGAADPADVLEAALVLAAAYKTLRAEHSPAAAHLTDTFRLDDLGWCWKCICHSGGWGWATEEAADRAATGHTRRDFRA